MNLAVFHSSIEPLIYGVVIFLGLLSIYWKLTHHRIFVGLLEIGVFILVFKLHGGTMTGGFAATVASLLAGMILPLLCTKR